MRFCRDALLKRMNRGFFDMSYVPVSMSGVVDFIAAWCDRRDSRDTQLSRSAASPESHPGGKIVVTGIGNLNAATEPAALVQAPPSLPPEVKSRFSLRFLDPIEEANFRAQREGEHLARCYAGQWHSTDECNRNLGNRNLAVHTIECGEVQWMYPVSYAY